MASFVFAGHKVSSSEKLAYLRGDPDIRKIDWASSSVHCVACTKPISFANRRAEAGIYQLDCWLYHKARCERLQDRYELEMAIAGRDRDSSGDTVQYSESGMSIDGPSRLHDRKSSKTGYTALFRLVSGELQQINYMQDRVTGRVVVKVTSEGRDETFTGPRFLTNGVRTSSEEKEKILKNDPDVSRIDWMTSRLWCGACGKPVKIGRNRQNSVHINTWINHKVTCKALQSKFKEEVRRRSTARDTTPSVDPESKEDEEALDTTLGAREQRRTALEADLLTGRVEPGRVWCKPCNKWLVLASTMSYSSGNWIQHKQRLHEHNVEAESDEEENSPGESTSVARIRRSKRRMPTPSDSESETEVHRVKRRRVESESDHGSMPELKSTVSWIGMGGAALTKIGEFLSLLL